METQSQQARFSIMATAPSTVQLNRFDCWWISLVSSVLKKILPPWQISVGLMTILALYTDDPLLTTLIILLWASLIFTWLYRKFKCYKRGLKWLIPLYHAALYPLVAMPCLAQTASTGACSSGGFFSTLTNFVSQIFQTVTFGNVGGNALSDLFCQLIGYITIVLTFSFLAAAGWVGVQVGHNHQPMHTAMGPLTGFLIFIGSGIVIMGVMVGKGNGGGLTG